MSKIYRILLTDTHFYVLQNPGFFLEGRGGGGGGVFHEQYTPHPFGGFIVQSIPFLHIAKSRLWKEGVGRCLSRPRYTTPFRRLYCTVKFIFKRCEIPAGSWAVEGGGGGGGGVEGRGKIMQILSLVQTGNMSILHLFSDLASKIQAHFPSFGPKWLNSISEFIPRRLKHPNLLGRHIPI